MTQLLLVQPQSLKGWFPPFPNTASFQRYVGLGPDPTLWFNLVQVCRDCVRSFGSLLPASGPVLQVPDTWDHNSHTGLEPGYGHSWQLRAAPPITAALGAPPGKEATGSWMCQVPHVADFEGQVYDSESSTQSLVSAAPKPSSFGSQQAGTPGELLT